MENYILGGILLLILGIAVFALVRAKRQGRRCIGCPYSASCKDGCHCGEKSQGKKK